MMLRAFIPIIFILLLEIFYLLPTSRAQGGAGDPLFAAKALFGDDFAA